MLGKVGTRWAAVAAAGLFLASTPTLAGGSAKFADDYEGYHLRPPYYIQGVGWHHPPGHRISREYYFGYHHHPTVGPKIYRQNARYVSRKATRVEWCRARYRSYRAADNSFQPLHGPRRQCCPPPR